MARRILPFVALAVFGLADPASAAPGGQVTNKGKSDFTLSDLSIFQSPDGSGNSQIILLTGNAGDDHVLKPGEAYSFNHDINNQTLISWFVKNVAAADPPSKPSPTWGTFDGSDHPPADGLWAVEPHIARNGIGVKWEELLVVAGADA